MFSFRSGPDGEVRLIGELDLAGTVPLRRWLEQLEGPVRFDCSDLTFIDAAGLGALIGSRNRCVARGQACVLQAPPRCLTKMLSILGLDGIFDVEGPDTRATSLPS